ncbi:hypothetical protein [Actinomadura parmotrematis]|uniref:Uncharacterized protein n=1 Tax=Actinomadura parmotrematis TaxID=2864039 RepID=A0ABS7G7V7_9ACTN|nr:hypothetical protein [Actinomadura parmotrematis]MBW8487718.1 hypothetical protein [Actinomadura parmotrematis]
MRERSRPTTVHLAVDGRVGDLRSVGGESGSAGGGSPVGHAGGLEGERHWFLREGAGRAA